MTKQIERADIFAAQRAVNLAALTADKIADMAAKGRDVEGEVTDLRLHLESIVAQLDEAMG
ncbi:MAG: hypothetical protein ACOH2N_13435 [Devosia sp.]